MTLRVLSGFAVVALAVSSLSVPAALAKPMSGASAVKMIDTDNDGTVDMKEVEAVASATFDRLEKDADGTLDARELKGRLSAAGVKQADPDSDGTLDKKEYLAAVAERFKLADPDSDGTLDAKELNSKAGKALLALIK
ncbi:EF-hand domain-containing protein [Methylobacterium sp. 2A]|uniref:EF-hand domain-containing protein n=1 Tax=Methylobacterium sp. 2A TaxID=2603816 RepID=UPI00135357A1|nr:EF-hand domain-containing protein [Methylobacterium sp. 2A]MWV20984.1 EF-hand domain-containing protein [Methylobacterium sp. 2A]